MVVVTPLDSALKLLKLRIHCPLLIISLSGLRGCVFVAQGVSGVVQRSALLSIEASISKTDDVRHVVRACVNVLVLVGIRVRGWEAVRDN